MPYFATVTPGAVTPNEPNKPNTADNAAARPNNPNSANAYVPRTNRENTPAAPVTPGLPNEPNEPNAYQMPALPSPAAPNQPNEPNGPNSPNVPNTPNASLSQGNVPVSANQPNEPNAANVPSISQGGIQSQNIQGNGKTTAQSGDGSGSDSHAGRSQHSETKAPQSLPSGHSAENTAGSGLGIVLGAVLLLTAVGFLAWKRKKKPSAKTDSEESAAPTSDQDSPETSPREP